MSGEATGFVWRESPHTGATLLVHLALADVANDAHANELWMSITGLAKKARISRSTASVALKELCKSGHLVLLQSGKNERKPSRYWMLTSPVSEQSVSERPESGLDKPGERSSTSPVSGQVTQENSKNESTVSISSLPKTPPPWRSSGSAPMDWAKRG